ncbi:type II toxin-antitoxin system RelE/ParE family toxin [Frankia sp. Cj5]|uniref:type II toxin-antitoxin system RelE family toxin n=1 Tax=Frankia sp. Cj5 TaxID=2880978 RepID=UPI001EF614C0|nr:type II toxin-antitoxin system RelE/ParE family toxin [Frankia sp. Cj5]
MAYEIEWTTRALRELRKLDGVTARRVLTAVTQLSNDPRPHGVRALVGEPSGVLRLRVGDYRVIYHVEDARLVVAVVRVAHRREVYRGS